ncbi:hypothetical protein UlMin_011721 [Ulmus minor]
MTIAEERVVPGAYKGKYKAMLICWILGLGTLIAWNSVMTIADYYYQLFPKYHPSRVLALVYQPFALGSMAILAYNESKINTRKRNLIGYSLYITSIFLLIVVDLASSGKGGVGAYICICLLVGSFGLEDALVEGGVVGDLSLMLPELLQSYMAGLAASGALASGLRLITKAAFEKTKNGLRKSTMLFLAISAFLEILCFLLYAFVFPKLPIVKHFRKKAATEGSKTVLADLAAAGIQQAHQLDVEDGSKLPQRMSNKQVLLKNLDYEINLFLIFMLSLSIIPGFLYENTGNHQLGTWYPLVLVTMFNLFDWLARYLPLISWLRIESRKGITFAVLCRFLFIPAFYFTAKYGDQGWMIMLTALLGLTNGHLTVCILTAAPKGFKGPEQNALGNFLVLFLQGGIAAGVILDWLWLIGKRF